MALWWMKNILLGFLRPSQHHLCLLLKSNEMSLQRRSKGTPKVWCCIKDAQTFAQRKAEIDGWAKTDFSTTKQIIEPKILYLKRLFSKYNLFRVWLQKYLFSVSKKQKGIKNNKKRKGKYYSWSQKLWWQRHDNSAVSLSRPLISCCV